MANSSAKRHAAAFPAVLVLMSGCTPPPPRPPSPVDRVLAVVFSAPAVLPALAALAAATWVLRALLFEINRDSRQERVQAKENLLPLRGRWLHYLLAAILALLTLTVVFAITLAL